MSTNQSMVTSTSRNLVLYIERTVSTQSVLSASFTKHQLNAIVSNLLAIQVPTAVVLQFRALLGLTPNLRRTYLSYLFPTPGASQGMTSTSSGLTGTPVNETEAIIRRILASLVEAFCTLNQIELVEAIVDLFSLNSSSSKLLRAVPLNTNYSIERSTSRQQPGSDQANTKKKKAKALQDDESYYCPLCKCKFDHEEDIRYHLKRKHLIQHALTQRDRLFDPLNRSFGPFKATDERASQQVLKARGTYHLVPMKLRLRWKKILDEQGKKAADEYSERKNTWRVNKYFGGGKEIPLEDGDVTDDEVQKKDGKKAKKSVKDNNTTKQETNEDSLFIPEELDDAEATHMPFNSVSLSQLPDPYLDEFEPLSSFNQSSTPLATQSGSTIRDRAIAGTENSIGNPFVSDEVHADRQRLINIFLDQIPAAGWLRAQMYLRDHNWSLEKAIDAYLNGHRSP